MNKKGIFFSNVVEGGRYVYQFSDLAQPIPVRVTHKAKTYAQLAFYRHDGSVGVTEIRGRDSSSVLFEADLSEDDVPEMPIFNFGIDEVYEGITPEGNVVRGKVVRILGAAVDLKTADEETFTVNYYSITQLEPHKEVGLLNRFSVYGNALFMRNGATRYSGPGFSLFYNGVLVANVLLDNTGAERIRPHGADTEELLDEFVSAISRWADSLGSMPQHPLHLFKLYRLYYWNKLHLTDQEAKEYLLRHIEKSDYIVFEEMNDEDAA